MTTFDEQVADQWRQRAVELADWTFRNLVNRTDVWGRYLAKPPREAEPGSRNQAITAPFRDERGKVFLDRSSLEKHFKASKPGGALGLHSSSSDRTSRWLVIDIDLHEPDDLSVTPEGNFAAAKTWRDRLDQMGFDPLLMDSNGAGGFHVMVVFSQPLTTLSVHELGRQLIADFQQLGLDDRPEVFPRKPDWRRYGDWLRLPGRHHTRRHYTRVWNDEPWADDVWLEGHDAIDRILKTRVAPPNVTQPLGLFNARRTICLDFDGVLHSYRSGWRGAEVIPDPPIHGTREAIIRLRKSFRVVIHSARCGTDTGMAAIQRWLDQHQIEVDEVCRDKPPAMVYVDDRAVPFRGSWDDVITEIHDFRR